MGKHRRVTHRVVVGSARLMELTSLMPEKTPPDQSRFMMCPMPGLLTQLHVKSGDCVKADQPLAVVEAMNMENLLRTSKPGTISRIAAVPGESLAVDQVILEIGCTGSSERYVARD